MQTSRKLPYIGPRSRRLDEISGLMQCCFRHYKLFIDRKVRGYFILQIFFLDNCNLISHLDALCLASLWGI